MNGPWQFLRLLLRCGFFFALAMCSAGGELKTLDGRSFSGALRFNDSGALVVNTPSGEETVEFTNIARAVFESGPFLANASVLANGWTLQDIGDVRGFTRLDDDTFSLRVEGQTTNAAACHFAGRPMHSDGEIQACIRAVGGDGQSRAGIMIRGTSSSVFASLSCGADGKIWFERRPDPDRKELRSTVVATTPAPAWLRLQKRGKGITASVSADGTAWRVVETDSTKLVMDRTWREHEGELHLLKASFGVFASSRRKDASCTARVAQVSMIQNGLLGEYFADAQCEKLAFTRLDPQVRFDWGSGSPDTRLDKDAFSVRWTGQFVPRKSGAFVFYFDADDNAKLWIDRKSIEQTGFKKWEKGPMPAPLTLVAGKPHEFKMEFADSNELASVKLGWALPGQKPEILDISNFVFSFTATNSPERILAGARTNNSPPVRGIVLRDGTFLAGTVASANESAIKFSFGGRKDIPVLNSRIARIVLRAPRQPLAYEVAEGRAGVFMKTGDFFESEFRGIQHGGLEMSSVLFGLRKMWIEGGDAAVVILNDCVPDSATYAVHLLDCSIIRAARVSVMGSMLNVEEPLLGTLSIPVSNLCELRRNVANVAAQ
jgi:hypothetical protein